MSSEVQDSVAVWERTPAASSDAMYEAFFSAVGSKPNETHDKLRALLPSVKSNMDDPRLKPTQPTHHPVFQDLIAPPDIHPLRKEWIDAKEELDDDVPLEEGDWVNVRGPEAEEVDEDGIPVVSAISRSSSGCILDAPGAVQIDNFTEEAEEVGNALGDDAEKALNFSLATLNQPQTGFQGALKPSQIGAQGALRQARTGFQGALKQPRTGVQGSLQQPQTGVQGLLKQAAEPVMTLDEELKLMRTQRGVGQTPLPGSGTAAAAAASSGTTHAAAAAAAASSGSRPAPAAAAAAAAPSGSSPGSDDSDDEPEVQVISAGKGPNLLPNWGDGGSIINSSSTAAAHSSGQPGTFHGPSGSAAAHQAAATAEAAAGSRDEAAEQLARSREGVVATLPGEPLASDSGATTQLMAVNTAAMLEHMGLGTTVKEDSDEEPDLELDLTKHTSNSAASAMHDPARQPSLGAPEAAAAAADGSSIGAAAAAAQHSAAAAPEAAADATAAAGPAAGEAAGGHSGSSLPASSTPAGATASAGPAAGAAGSSSRQPAGPPPAGGTAEGAPAAADGEANVTYATVEGFKLDPDFDYDNVKLTPREFPYNMIRARQVPFDAKI